MTEGAGICPDCDHLWREHVGSPNPGDPRAGCFCSCMKEPPSYERAWPDTPWRMTDEELRDFTLLWIGDRILSHVHLETWKALPPEGPRNPRALKAYADEFAATWPLWVLYLETHGAPPESFTEKVGLFWSPVDAMVRECFPDVPRIMHRDDWKRVLATLAQAEEANDDQED